jgi:hypothetical protein
MAVIWRAMIASAMMARKSSKGRSEKDIGALTVLLLLVEKRAGMIEDGGRRLEDADLTHPTAKSHLKTCLPHKGRACPFVDLRTHDTNKGFEIVTIAHERIRAAQLENKHGKPLRIIQENRR